MHIFALFALAVFQLQLISAVPVQEQLDYSKEAVLRRSLINAGVNLNSDAKPKPNEASKSHKEQLAPFQFLLDLLTPYINSVANRSALLVPHSNSNSTEENQYPFYPINVNFNYNNNVTNSTTSINTEWEFEFELGSYSSGNEGHSRSNNENKSIGTSASKIETVRRSTKLESNQPKILYQIY